MFGNKKGKFEITVASATKIPCYTSESKESGDYYSNLYKSFSYKDAQPGTVKIHINKKYKNPPINCFSGIEFSFCIYVSPSNNKPTCVFIIDGKAIQDHIKDRSQELKPYVVHEKLSYDEHTLITKEFTNEADLKGFFQILNEVNEFTPEFLLELQKSGFNYDFVKELENKKREHFVVDAKTKGANLKPEDAHDCSVDDINAALIKQVDVLKAENAALIKKIELLEAEKDALKNQKGLGLFGC